MKWLLVLLLGVLSPLAAAQTDEQCSAFMLYKEARGESKRTARAVLDVFKNRQEAWELTACQVLRQKGQYPYAKRGVKKLDFAAVARYHDVSMMWPVLDKGYIYFNHVKHPFGRNTVKIGKLYFSQ